MLCGSEVPVPAVGTMDKEDITTTTVIHYVEYDNPKYYGFSGLVAILVFNIFSYFIITRHVQMP